MTLSDVQTAIDDGGLINRVKAALTKTAISVSFEAADTANHTARLDFSKQVLVNNSVNAANVNRYVVGRYYADHPADTVDQLKAMSDATLQSYVDASLAVFAG